MLAYIQNYFTFGFSKIFAIKLSYFPAHINYVSTSPCKTKCHFIILPLHLLQQKALLTLRKQRGHCRNINGNPKYLWVCLTQVSAHFFFWVWFYGGPWQTPAASKFKVAIFSRGTNIEANPNILGSLSSPRPLPLFLRCGILWRDLKNLESSPSSRPHPRFLSVWFYDRLGKPKQYTKLEVASFSHCVNIEGEPPNFRELF